MTTTKATQHTPGPWKNNGGRIEGGDYGSRIAVVATVGKVNEQSQQDTANARLIAAAPTMYEAIRDTLDLAQPELPSHIVKQLSAALNAADGGK